MNAHFPMNIKINGSQEDHRCLDPQIGEPFVLKPVNIFGPPFLNSYLLICLRMNLRQANRCTTC